MVLSATVEAMEAMVAERGTEMTEWNDGRLDDLSDRVNRIETKMDDGFARLEKKMDDGFARVDATFARMDARLDDLNGTLIRSMWTFGVGMLTFAGALLGIIADK
jgi:hypothetical protein